MGLLDKTLLAFGPIGLALYATRHGINMTEEGSGEQLQAAFADTYDLPMGDEMYSGEDEMVTGGEGDEEFGDFDLGL